MRTTAADPRPSRLELRLAEGAAPPDSSGDALSPAELAALEALFYARVARLPAAPAAMRAFVTLLALPLPTLREVPPLVLSGHAASLTPY